MTGGHWYTMRPVRCLSPLHHLSSSHHAVTLAVCPFYLLIAIFFHPRNSTSHRWTEVLEFSPSQFLDFPVWVYFTVSLWTSCHVESRMTFNLKAPLLSQQTNFPSYRSASQRYALEEGQFELWHSLGLYIIKGDLISFSFHFHLFYSRECTALEFF